MYQEQYPNDAASEFNCVSYRIGTSLETRILK